MSRSRRAVPVALALLAATLAAPPRAPLAAQVVAERVDLDALGKIREEATQRSQVMAIAGYLTDVIGP
ncbi:MAG: hypothetical protein KJT01_15940, partial [Gemmatimonadetes bacterium]|nr:hypothetical protein [Gemmatimonadota bacterium]